MPLQTITSRLVVPSRKRPRFFILMRKIRAIWHDTSALWTEFRVPILGFILVTVGGGWLYGELYYHARGVVIPMIDRPYIMLQLMVLETPEDAPPEWFLILFWYALPPAFVFLVGLGASDFLHLFFNRTERRDAWGIAVASTYRQHIIVFGAGHVGLRVVRELVEMGFDVVVIDNAPDPGVEDTLQELDVPLILGEGRESLVLERAGLRHAEAFVACTGDDHINLEIIMRARDMNPDVRIVARVWDDQYAHQIARFMNVQSVLSSSDLSAPAFAGAAVGIEIAQTIEINDVEYSMIRLTVMEGSFLIGRTVGDLQRENRMDIVLHGHGENADVQPAREQVVAVGDTLVIFAEHQQNLNVVARNHRYHHRR